MEFQCVKILTFNRVPKCKRGGMKIMFSLLIEINELWENLTDDQ